MSPMNRYFENLTTVFRNVAVTLGDGRAVELSEGTEEAVRIIMNRTQAGRKVIFIGNGGSAAIASHQAGGLRRHGLRARGPRVHVAMQARLVADVPQVHLHRVELQAAQRGEIRRGE